MYGGRNTSRMAPPVDSTNSATILEWWHEALSITRMSLGYVLSRSCRNSMNVSEFIASMARMRYPSDPKEPISFADFWRIPV